jgi:hypothetical protein
VCIGQAGPAVMPWVHNSFLTLALDRWWQRN